MKTTIRVDDDLLREAKDYLRKEKTNVNEFVTWALTSYVRGKRGEKKEEREMNVARNKINKIERELRNMPDLIRVANEDDKIILREKHVNMVYDLAKIKKQFQIE